MGIHNGHIAILALFLLAGCSKAVSVPDGGAVPVVLSASIDDAAVKGTAALTTASLQESGFGLLAWRTDAGTYFNGDELYLENLQFLYDDGASVFRAAEPAWWPLGSWLSFMAYAPYKAGAHISNVSGLLIISSGAPGGMPRLSYTPASDPLEQEDLILSAPVWDRASSEGTVPLNFSHVLTKVFFRARWTADASVLEDMDTYQYYVRIKSIELDNILGENALTYTRNGFRWDTPTTLEMASLADASYTLSMAGGTLVAASNASSAIPLLDPASPGTYYGPYVEGDDYGDSFAPSPAAALYLLPQALVPSASVTVTYGYYTADGRQQGSDIVQDAAIGNLPTYVWPAGATIAYNLTLDLSGELIVEPAYEYKAHDAGTFLIPGELEPGASSAGSFTAVPAA